MEEGEQGGGASSLELDTLGLHPSAASWRRHRPFSKEGREG